MTLEALDSVPSDHDLQPGSDEHLRRDGHVHVAVLDEQYTSFERAQNLARITARAARAEAVAIESSEPQSVEKFPFAHGLAHGAPERRDGHLGGTPTPITTGEENPSKFTRFGGE